MNEGQSSQQEQADADDRTFQDAVAGQASDAKPVMRQGEEIGGPTAALDQEHILQYFRYEHLPAHLQEISRPFGELAQNVIMKQPRNPERSVALRKLLESKDAAVRAALAQ
jgi:hypothetical protein